MPVARQVLLSPKVHMHPNNNFLNEKVVDLVFDHYNDTGSTVAPNSIEINNALKLLLPDNVAVQVKLIGCPGRESVILKSKRADDKVYQWSEGAWKSIDELLPSLKTLTVDKEKKLNLVYNK